MVRTSTTVLSSALLASSAMAGWSKPEPVCEVVTVTYTGAITWIPDPTWSDWVSTKTKTKPAPVSTVTETWVDWTTVDPTTTETWVDWTTVDPTTTETWADWTTVDPSTVTETWVDWTTVDPTTTETWVDWTTVDPSTVTETWTDWVDPTHKHKTTTTTTTTTETWADWDTTAAPTTTPTTPPSWPATTTTTTPPAAAPTCPADNGKTVFPGGSCGCGFTVNCDVHADVGASAVFWEQTSGALYDTLAECLALCDSNADCTAAIWTDDPTNGDYHHCWQTSGLGGIISAGVGQISYKGTCSGACSAAYNS